MSEVCRQRFRLSGPRDPRLCFKGKHRYGGRIGAANQPGDDDLHTRTLHATVVLPSKNIRHCYEALDCNFFSPRCGINAGLLEQ